MQQLGSGFTNSFLLPYIKTQILGNIENDTRLQNMFRYDKVLRPDEFSGLVDEYFADTGSILENDTGLKTAFWKEFNEFIQRQKNLCNGNALKLTFRLLPDEKSGTFSQEAEQNLQKFSFYAASALEDTLIQREIQQKEILGKISSAQAADDKKALKDGKMILVRKKDGKFDYMKDETIARAIGNVERTAKMLSELKTEKTEKGESRVYTFNPIGVSDSGKEVTSSPQQVQEQLWAKQSIRAEKDLEDNGLFVEAHMSVDANGISRGFAKDKNGIRLRVEFDVKKPGERVYRMTFVNDPDSKFFISESEMKDKFGVKKQSAHEVYREKEAAAGRTAGVAKMKGSRVRSGAAGPIKLPEDRKVKITPPTTQRPPEGAGGLGATPYVPNVKPKESKQRTEAEITKEQETHVKGALKQKEALEARMKGRPGRKPVDGSMKSKGQKGDAGRSGSSAGGKKKSFMKKVAKIYAAAFGGAFGFGMISSFFT